MIQSLVPIAYRNVKNNWRHSLAAVISISAGFVAQVLFSGYMEKVSKMYYDSYRHRTMYGDVIIHNKQSLSVEAKSNPFKFYLDKATQSKVDRHLTENSENVYESARFLQAQGMITNGRTSTIFLALGYDVDRGAKIRGKGWAWNTIYGLPLQNTKLPGRAVLGQSLGRLMGCKPEKKVVSLQEADSYKAENRPFTCVHDQVQLSVLTESGQLNAMDLSVVGLIDAGYKEIDNKYLQTSLENTQTLLNTDKVSYYTVQMKHPRDAESFINHFNEKMKAEGNDLEAMSWQQHPVADMYLQTMDLLRIFKVFVVTVILIISCLSILNTMIKIVKERTREIGTLRSLGFFQNQVTAIFGYEAFLLSAIGCSIGAIASLILTIAMNSSGLTYRAGVLSEPVLFLIQVNPITYMQSFLLLTSLSVVTALVATRGTARKKVAENLSHA